MCFLSVILGLIVVFGAQYPVQRFVDWVQHESNIEPREKGVPSWIVGLFERLLAFLLFALLVKHAETLLIAWMAAKLAANWQRRPWPKNTEVAREIRAHTFTALMAGTLSLGFGVLGGVIAHCGCR
jgi:hypothetical protein